MNSRFFVCALAAAALGAALPALAQGSGPDRNVPEIPNQQARPLDRNSFEGAQAERPPRAAERREQHRPPQQTRPEARRDHDHKHPDRRNWDHRGHDRRDFGYVVPRPNYYSPPAVYYSAPPVYYSAPPLYYGSIPQTNYPYISQTVFQRGDFLPPEYRQQQYVVEDWQWRGLAAPPYGYHWLVLGPDYYVLVADSTGQIVHMVATR